MRSDQERSLDRIEGLVCFVLGYLAHGWVGVVWFAGGMACIFGWFSWATRRVARRLEHRR